tara:strand:- start:63 stop:746 length:684 start_codon:yes stop_codon:yes gene_type:complete
MNDVVRTDHPLLNDEQFGMVEKLQDELLETAHKAQGFRTPTEMRFSVLNDHRFTTYAAKYWQSVREQNVHYGQLVQLSHAYRRNEVLMLRIKERLNIPDITEIDRMETQIDLDEAEFNRHLQQIEAKHRVDEITEWSTIKQECINNPEDEKFDTENVNTHQAENYLRNLQHRASALTPGSSQPEVLNVLGPLNTLRRILGLKPEPAHVDVPWINGPTTQVKTEYAKP